MLGSGWEPMRLATAQPPLSVEAIVEQKGTLWSQFLPQETEESLALVFCVPHILLFLAFLLVAESR